MKKILTMALILVMGAAAINAASPKKDKKKGKAEEPVAAAVVLATPSDSVNYTAGMAQTNGLIPFLLQQKMDTAYMADFIRGFKEAVERTEDPAYVAYKQGLSIATMVTERMLPGFENQLKGSDDTFDRAMFLNGFIAALKNDTTAFTLEKAEKFINERMEANHKAKLDKAKKVGADFLAENAKKEGVQTTASGLQYKVLVKGEGEIPTTSQQVTVKYEGKLIDGTVFDSSYERNPQTTQFRADQVIKGWTEALTMMPVGSTWELYIPYNLAYGEREQGKIPACSCLIFKVELISIDK